MTINSTSSSKCKYCGKPIKWFKENGKWFPTDPLTGQDHRSICVGGPDRVTGLSNGTKLTFKIDEDMRYRLLDKRVKALEVLVAELSKRSL